MLSPLVWVKAHPKGAAIAGVGGVAGFVLLKRRSSTTNAAGQSDGSAGSAAAAGQMGTGVYDSTANDVYSSLEPAIEGLYGQVSALQQQIGSGVTQLDTTTAPAPVASGGTKQPPWRELPPKLPGGKTIGGKRPPRKTTTRKPAPTRKPAAVTTHKPTAKPPTVKRKPKKTPKPAHGAPASNKKTLGDLLGAAIPKGAKKKHHKAPKPAPTPLSKVLYPGLTR